MRRTLLSWVAGAVAGSMYPSASSIGQTTHDPVAAPTFEAGGPQASHYGYDEGYPVPDAWRARREGNPWTPRYRVGAFSHFDAIYATRTVQRPATSSAFKRSTLHGDPSLLADYVARNPVTALLVAKDDEILYEHYQYGRTDRDRLLSQSMVKSITGLLIGIAIADRAIGSVDDAAERYVAGFKGTEYGRTSIRDLLHMASGVDFGEDAEDGRDLDRLWRDMVAGEGRPPKGTVRSIAQFDRRVASPGTTFHYASIEADVLGVVLQHAIKRPATEYLQEKVWSPIGAEADAKWLIDAEGMEVAHFGFNAVIRDYARLARLVASDGAWGDRQIVPASWMHEATTTRASDEFLSPGRAMRKFGYGYLVWLLEGGRRQFAFVGQCGQRICVDPASRIVMVHTALEDNENAWRLWSALTKERG